MRSSVTPRVRPHLDLPRTWPASARTRSPDPGDRRRAYARHPDQLGSTTRQRGDRSLVREQIVSFDLAGSARAVYGEVERLDRPARRREVAVSSRRCSVCSSGPTTWYLSGSCEAFTGLATMGERTGVKPRRHTPCRSREGRRPAGLLPPLPASHAAHEAAVHPLERRARGSSERQRNPPGGRTPAPGPSAECSARRTRRPHRANRAPATHGPPRGPGARALHARYARRDPARPQIVGHAPTLKPRQPITLCASPVVASTWL